MSGLSRVMRFGVSGGSGGGIDPGDPGDARLTGPAINSGVSQQFGTSPLYLNVIKNNYTDWSAGTRDANEQLATLSPGTTSNRSLWANYGEDIAFCIKQGTYWLRWSGTTGVSAVPVTVSGPGVSNVVRVDASTVTFDFNNTSSESTVRAYFTNNTGSSTFQIQNLSCVFTDYKTLYDGGEIFSPDYLACMPDNILAWRMTNAAQMWGNPTTVASQVRPETADSYSYYQDGDPAAHFFTGMPYEVGAQLAIKLGCDLIAPFPLAGNQATYNLAAQRLYSKLALSPDRHVICPPGNENWSSAISNTVAGPSYLHTFGAAQTPPIDSPAAEAKKCLMIWKALADAGFPRSQVIRTVEVQLYGNAVPGAWIGDMMLSVDTDGLVQQGARFCDLLDRIHTAPYCHFHNGTYQGQMYHTRLLNLDWVNLTDAQILAYFQSDINEITATILNLRAQLLATTGRNIPIGCYEWGHETTLNFGNLSGQFYQFHIDQPNNKIVWEAGFLPVTFTDGDYFRHDNTYIAPAGNGSNYIGPASGVCAASIGNFGYANIRRVDANSARFYTSPALATTAYTDDTAARIASIPLTSPPTQVYTADNYSRWVDMKARMETFLTSAAGQTLYQNFHAGTIGPTLLSYPTQYHDVGGWPITQFAQWWGLKHGPLSPVNPRFSWYKALPA